MFGVFLKSLLNIFFILFVCGLLLPVCAEDIPIQVQRRVKKPIPNTTQINKAKPDECPQIPKNNLQIIKAKGENYAKHRLSIPKNREKEISSTDFCDISNELKQYGAENIRITLFDTKYNKEDKPVMNGRSFKNSRYCIKITFTYGNKPYDTGWCR